MKSLLVLRHAKSSWKETDMADHDRPLNKRGKNDAPRVGNLLRKERLIPELVLSSSARRASDTAEAAVEASGYFPEIRQLPGFYQCDLKTFYDTLRLLPSDLDRVMIVGHNPELEQLVAALTAETVSLPTAALAHISLPIQAWSELAPTTRGRLVNVYVPDRPD